VGNLCTNIWRISNQCKNYSNLLRIDKVIIKVKWHFFMVHSVHIVYCASQSRTMIGWLDCGTGKLLSSSSSVSGGGGRGGAVSRGSGGLGGAWSAFTHNTLTLTSTLQQTEFTYQATHNTQCNDFTYWAHNGFLWQFTKHVSTSLENDVQSWQQPPCNAATYNGLSNDSFQHANNTEYCDNNKNLC